MNKIKLYKSEEFKKTSKNKIKKFIKTEATFDDIEKTIVNYIKSYIYYDEIADKCKYKVKKSEFYRVKRHIIERIQKGYSYRDSWNVDMWFVNVMSGIIHNLWKNTHGFPDNVINLHEKIKEITNTKYEFKQKKTQSIDDYKFELYKHDLETIIWHLNQSTEKHCLMINKYKFINKSHDEEVVINGVKMYKIIDDCNESEKLNNRKYLDQEIKIAKYRSDMLHKAMKMLDIYIETLWD